jgi:hypothetical protein
MSVKIHPKGVTPHHTGATFTCNDPAKFHGAGKTTGKPDGDSTIMKQKTGPTLDYNSTPVNMPSANSNPKGSKVIGSKDGHFKPDGHGEGASGKSGKSYGLKDSYTKSGKHSSKGPRSVF